MENVGEPPLVGGALPGGVRGVPAAWVRVPARAVRGGTPDCTRRVTASKGARRTDAAGAGNGGADVWCALRGVRAWGGGDGGGGHLVVVTVISAF